MTTMNGDDLDSDDTMVTTATTSDVGKSSEKDSVKAKNQRVNDSARTGDEGKTDRNAHHERVTMDTHSRASSAVAAGDGEGTAKLTSSQGGFSLSGGRWVVRG